MKKLTSIFCALLLFSPAVFAQSKNDVYADIDSAAGDETAQEQIDEEDEDEQDDSEEDEDSGNGGYKENDGDVGIDKNPDGDRGKKSVNIGGVNEPGDQYIKLGLMPSFPMNFDGSLLIGGAGALGYHRFLLNWLAVGVDVNFGYHPTIGSNVFTYVPVLAGVTIQPCYKRFEFPVTLEIGAAMENYLHKNYFPGFVAKAEAGAYFRATSAWSFGANFDFMFMPQWYSDSKYNDYGIFIAAEISARYHF